MQETDSQSPKNPDSQSPENPNSQSPENPINNVLQTQAEYDVITSVIFLIIMVIILIMSFQPCTEQNKMYKRLDKDMDRIERMQRSY